LTLAAYVVLKFAEHAEHVQEGAAGRGRRVDRRVEDAQARALAFKLGDDRGQVRDTARQAIELGYDQHMRLLSRAASK
jgi:hypothetical protein